MKYVIQQKVTPKPRLQLDTSRLKSPRADSDWSEDIPRPSTIEVWESEEQYTGILDIHGNEFVRVRETLGFFDPEEL